jgi:hypothetical protein
MTRMNPLRRTAAAVAILGVTGFGAVALASPALADTGAPAVSVEAPAKPVKPIGELNLPAVKGINLGDLMSAKHEADGMGIQSPLPDGPVTLKLGPVKLALQPQVAQQVQTVAANVYADLGYQVAFTERGLLTIGKKICDLSQPKDSARNKDCTMPGGPRF